MEGAGFRPFARSASVFAPREISFFAGFGSLAVTIGSTQA